MRPGARGSDLDHAPEAAVSAPGPLNFRRRVQMHGDRHARDLEADASGDGDGRSVPRDDSDRLTDAERRAGNVQVSRRRLILEVIGAAGEKIEFCGATPVTQPAGANQA